MVGVNVGVAAPMAFFPFAGWKNSFFGDLHAHGKDAVMFYTEQKVIMTPVVLGVRCGARTHACRVHTRVNAGVICSHGPRRRHECRRGTHKCVRYTNDNIRAEPPAHLSSRGRISQVLHLQSLGSRDGPPQALRQPRTAAAGCRRNLVEPGCHRLDRKFSSAIARAASPRRRRKAKQNHALAFEATFPAMTAVSAPASSILQPR